MQGITDERIVLLWEDDLKELIPELGPRRQFQRMLKALQSQRAGQGVAHSFVD